MTPKTINYKYILTWFAVSIVKNKQFGKWLNYFNCFSELLNVVYACFDTRSDHQRLSDIFVQKGPYLKMYSTYIRQFDNNVALLDEQCRKNTALAAVVREFEVTHIPRLLFYFINNQHLCELIYGFTYFPGGGFIHSLLERLLETSQFS